MPMYEYACPSCHHIFEQLVPSEAAGRKATCPKCGMKSVERRPAVFATHAAPASHPLPAGGCGKCGNPDGPCQWGG